MKLRVVNCLTNPSLATAVTDFMGIISIKASHLMIHSCNNSLLFFSSPSDNGARRYHGMLGRKVLDICGHKSFAMPDRPGIPPGSCPRAGDIRSFALQGWWEADLLLQGDTVCPPLLLLLCCATQALGDIGPYSAAQISSVCISCLS